MAASPQALGVCDVCGFTCNQELKNVYKKGRDTNIKACPECWDGDHPQLKLGEFPVNDPQAAILALTLINMRPVERLLNQSNRLSMDL